MVHYPGGGTPLLPPLPLGDSIVIRITISSHSYNLPSLMFEGEHPQKRAPLPSRSMSERQTFPIRGPSGRENTKVPVIDQPVHER